MMKPTPIQKLGRRVRERRRALRLTQEELALLSGCGALFVRQLEKGKHTVRLGKLLDVLGVLGLTLDLVDGPEPLRVRDA